MAGGRIQGTFGVAAFPEPFDAGTLFRGASPTPGTLVSVDPSMRLQPSWGIQEPIAHCVAAAKAFAGKTIADGQARTRYLAEVNAGVAGLLTAVRQRRIAAADGNRLAGAMKSKIMDAVRLSRTSRGEDFDELLTALSDSPSAIVKTLLMADFPRRSEADKTKTALELIRALRFPWTSMHQLSPREPVDRWLWLLTGSLAWIGTCGSLRNLRPWRPVQRIHQAKAAPAPRASGPPPPPPRRRTPVESAPAPQMLEHVDQSVQAATLIAAAESGVPFCEECEKARQQREAQRAG